ncbi:MAG: MerR family transcriptional regulator [Desulfovibrionaceae bacterium]|nr:MerR family transcriptional regulator [Desulfovibrionaceae bacterium]
MGEKLYRIGEAAELLDLKTYVLRFWETEFPQLAPLRTDKGQRLYSEEHLSILRRIKQLLHEQGMTIEGARRILQGDGAVVGKTALDDRIDPTILTALKEDLLEIRMILMQKDDEDGEYTEDYYDLNPSINDDFGSQL